MCKMEEAIDLFIRFLAIERGLSENYQLSTQRSLSEFARWCAARKKIEDVRSVTLPAISEYLADRKRAGLSASSIKLIVVALKIFFRFLVAQGKVQRDPAEALTLPRIERYLPETLNELQIEQFLERIDTNAVHGLRDRAMIELLYASGLRISELANARRENFQLEHRDESSSTQLRDTYPGERRRSAHHPGNARQRRYLDDASLYARRPTAIESCASAISSESVAGVIPDPRPWIPKQFAFDPVSSIEYPASAALRRSWL